MSLRLIIELNTVLNNPKIIKMFWVFNDNLQRTIYHELNIKPKLEKLGFFRNPFTSSLVSEYFTFELNGKGKSLVVTQEFEICEKLKEQKNKKKVNSNYEFN